MGLYIVKADLTNRNVDAIVCTANENLKLGGLLGDKILSKAGPLILEELNQIKHCDVGCSVITRGYNLNAKNVIHTVGPVYKGGSYGEAKCLEKAYLSALNLAMKYKLETIEFPLISAGTNQYPDEEAAAIAIKTITEFIKENELSVGLVIYSDDTFNKCKHLFKNYQCFTGTGFVSDIVKDTIERIKNAYFSQSAYQYAIEEEYVFYNKSKSLKDEWIELDGEKKSFKSRLQYYLSQSKKTNVQIYKKAGMDRKLFSSIISSKHPRPKKNTVIRLIIGLELPYSDANDLMLSAGYSFAEGDLYEFIIASYIKLGNYELNIINQALYESDCPEIT